MAWLLDTNIISETRRLKPEPKVLAFIADHPLEDLYISAVTLAELRFGIELLSQDTGHRTGLNVERRVLPITEDVMLRRRILVDDGRKAGLTYSQPDLIIAATAPHYDLTLVTRDRGDFEKARVPVLNPWDAS